MESLLVDIRLLIASFQVHHGRNWLRRSKITDLKRNASNPGGIGKIKISQFRNSEDNFVNSDPAN